MLVLPASIGVAVLANPMVRVMLGEKWSDAVPVIQVLALSGAVTATLSNNVSAYLALGLPKLVTLILATRLAVLVPGLLYLSDQFNLVGFALAEGLAAVACLGVSYPVLFRQLQLSTGEFFSNLWRPFAASATMGLGVHALVSSVPFDVS
jgi:lipopolysaccharide exporter